jgi:hypothetical protein
MTYICVNTEELELLDFDVEVVAQLAFFCEEISVVTVVKTEIVFSERSAESVFKPVRVPE